MGLISKTEFKLSERDITEDIDFMDGEPHQVVIEYREGELSVLVVDSAQPNLDATPPVLLLKTELNLQDYVKLDNGCGYLGFA